MTIVELREKRAKLWATMEGFLDTHRNDKGVLSTEDDAVYANMEKELNDLTNKYPPAQPGVLHSSGIALFY